MATPESTSKVGRSRGKDKREAIMQAAEDLFTSRRFHEITMDDVAAAAGVAKGTLYGHFADKDDLFFQTCTSGFDQLCEVIASATPTDASFKGQLLTTCRQISQFMDRRRSLMRMVQAEEARMSYCRGGMHDRWREKRRRLVGAIGQILAKGVEDKVIRGDVSLEVLANVLMGMLRARARGFADAPATMPQHEVIVDLFCHGAAPRETRTDTGNNNGAGVSPRFSCPPDEQDTQDTPRKMS